MASPQIVPLNASDLDLIVDIESRAHQKPWNKTKWLDSLANHRCWVMKSKAEILGYMAVSVVLDQWELLNVVVDPKVQSRGNGSRWMEFLEAEARRNSASVILLEVRESNHNAIALYRKQGFELDGKRKGYYRNGSAKEDAFLMSKSLK